MKPTVDPAIASRLCAACGLCCNGVLFQEVHLQPEDSIKEIASLGLRLKSRRGGRYFEQPCRAFCGTHCAVYNERPTRCRSFNCRQLARVAAGVVDEETALQTIERARQLIGEVEELLAECGARDRKRSIKKRFEKATSEPVSAEASGDETESRQRLVRQYSLLTELLEAQFRVDSEEAGE